MAHPGGNPEGFPDGEQSDGDGDDVDAVQKLRDTEGEPALAGEGVDTNQTKRQTDKETEQPSHDRAAKQGGNGGEGEENQGEVLGRSKLQTYLNHHRGQNGQTDGADRAGHE